MRLLDRALDVQEILDRDDLAKCCDLMLALNDALILTPDLERVIDSSAAKGLTLAEKLGDHQRAARFCCQALDALHRARSPVVFGEPAWSHWAEIADHYAQEETSERVRADMALGLCIKVRGYEERWRLRLKTLDLARRLDNRHDMFLAASSSLFTDVAPAHWDERLRIAWDFSSMPHDGVGGTTVASVLWWCGAIMLTAGDRGAAEEVWRRLQGVASATNDSAARLFPLFSQTVLQVMDGQLEAAVQNHELTVARATEMGMQLFGQGFSEGVAAGLVLPRQGGRRAQ